MEMQTDGENDKGKPTPKVNDNRPIAEYPPILQARHIMALLGISEAKAYEVLNAKKCPTIRMGKRMVVMRDSFIEFLCSCQGGNLID